MLNEITEKSNRRKKEWSRTISLSLGADGAVSHLLDKVGAIPILDKEYSLLDKEHSASDKERSVFEKDHSVLKKEHSFLFKESKEERYSIYKEKENQIKELSWKLSK